MPKIRSFNAIYEKALKSLSVDGIYFSAISKDSLTIFLSSRDYSEEFLRKNRVTHIIDLTEIALPTVAERRRGENSSCIGIAVGAYALNSMIIDATNREPEAPPNNVLIHCREGRERTPAAVAYYLIRYVGYKGMTALNLTQEALSQRLGKKMNSGSTILFYAWLNDKNKRSLELFENDVFEGALEHIYQDALTKSKPGIITIPKFCQIDELISRHIANPHNESSTFTQSTQSTSDTTDRNTTSSYSGNKEDPPTQRVSTSAAADANSVSSQPGDNDDPSTTSTHNPPEQSLSESPEIARRILRSSSTTALEGSTTIRGRRRYLDPPRGVRPRSQTGQTEKSNLSPEEIMKIHSKAQKSFKRKEPGTSRKNPKRTPPPSKFTPK